MKSKLAVGINVYNDTPGLKRCIDSLYEHVDLIVIIDGKYLEWGKPDDPALSNDGLIKMLIEYYGWNKIILVPMPNTDQATKRTKYLEVAGEQHCTHLLVIDADEYIQQNADWDLFRWLLDNNPRFDDGLNGNTQYSHNIDYYAQPNSHLSLARLIYRPGDLIYRSHWLLFRKKDGSPTAYQNVGDPYTVKGIVITTDEGLRSEDRIKQDIDYQWLLFLQEGEITFQKYNDPKEKEIFAKHIIWEWQATRKLKQ